MDRFVIKFIISIRYMNCVSALKASTYECLHDADTLKSCSSKRILKSFKNSTKLIEDCLKIAKDEKVFLLIFTLFATVKT